MKPVPALRQHPDLFPHHKLRQTDRAIIGSDHIGGDGEFWERFEDFLFEAGRRGEGGDGGRGGREAADPGASGHGEEAEDADHSAEERREDDHQVVGVRVRLRV